MLNADIILINPNPHNCDIVTVAIDINRNAILTEDGQVIITEDGQTIIPE